MNRSIVPLPLKAAAALVAVEGLVLAALGLAEVVHLSGDRLTMGVTVSVFFLAFAALLLVSGWGLLRLQSWARGPALLTQIICLGLAWNFRGGGTGAVSAALLVIAVVTLVGLLNARSRQALEGE